jgi:ribosomal protein L35
MTIGKVTRMHNMASHPLIKKSTEQRSDVNNMMASIPRPLEVKATTNPVRKGTIIKSPGP